MKRWKVLDNFSNFPKQKKHITDDEKKKLTQFVTYALKNLIKLELLTDTKIFHVYENVTRGGTTRSFLSMCRNKNRIHV